jgi:diguanylate cyclase (GGDEF)-like protein
MFPVKPSDAEIFIEIEKLNLSAWELILDEALNQARPILERVNELLSQVKDHGLAYQQGRVSYLVNMGGFEQYIGPKSLQYFIEACSIVEDIPFPTGLLDTLTGLSWGYYFLGDYVKAKSYVERAIQLAESLDDANRLWRARNAAGAILSDTNEVERALGYLQANIVYLSDARKSHDSCIAYNNFAMTLLSCERYVEAEEAALQALDMVAKWNHPLTAVCVLDTLGLVYKGKKEYDLSLLYYREAISIQTPLRYRNINFEPYLNLGDVLLLTGDLEEAEKTLKIALKLVLEKQGSRLEYVCYEKLAEIAERKGNYKLALEYYQRFHKEKERIFNHQKINQIADLTSTHKMENTLKDARILELQNVSLRRQIESEKQRHEELEYLATTDPLTGLLNRRHFGTLANFQFENARKLGQSLSVIMFDIDHFKTVNDQFGHRVGDGVLVKVVEAINLSIRAGDLACRYGGEEFLLLIPGLDMASALMLADRVRMAIETLSMSVGDEAINITISAGVATLKDEIVTLEDLIERADQRMLKAKTLGRNTILPKNN